MKTNVVTCFVLLLGVADAALAQCSSSTADRVQGSDLTNLLSNSRVCGRPVPDNVNGRWQEQHRAGNQLWDYKLGAVHPVDPTKQMGTWQVSGTGANTIVTYVYNTFSPSETFTLSVYCAETGSGTNKVCPPKVPTGTVVFYFLRRGDGEGEGLRHCRWGE